MATGKKFSRSEVRTAVLLKTQVWEVRSCRLGLSKKISLGLLYPKDEGTAIREMLATTTIVNDQLDAKLIYFILCLLQSSTCFEQRRAHHQEVNLY